MSRTVHTTRVGPIAPLSTAADDHLALLRAACASGTIFCPGTDVHGRAIVCIDNSAAPVGPFDGQVRLLAFTIEFALRQCVAPSNKIWCVTHVTYVKYVTV